MTKTAELVAIKERQNSYEEIDLCLALAKAGDRDKMGELIVMLEPLIKKQVRYYFGRLDEDFMQMGRIRAFELIERFDPAFTDIKFLGYMKRFLGCFFWDLKKQELKNADLINGFVDMEELSEIATYVEEGFLRIETEDLLQGLSPSERYVIEAHVMDRVSLAELSREMGLSRDQVRYLKKKGLDSLRAGK